MGYVLVGADHDDRAAAVHAALLEDVFAGQRREHAFVIDQPTSSRPKPTRAATSSRLISPTASTTASSPRRTSSAICMITPARAGTSARPRRWTPRPCSG